MRASKKYWVFELILVAACCAAAPARAESLCAPNEPVVFACHVGSKMVSLCRPAGDWGMLSYRFGGVGKLELTYPEPGRQASAAFTVKSVPLVGGGETTVAFKRGVYTYTVYSKVARGSDGSTPEFEDGVIVARRGKVLSRMRCADGGEGFREPMTAVAVK
ncbi:hypothetical protein ACHAC9_04580 [Massilia sp. CMS3.1]|uniref:hypothetical protein n=1 Tax=Massilia sp. CMS3.1 TaxID=3373083 RepID=UPI003EE4A97C